MLGERIKERRRAKHLTQAALADCVGMARAAIANIETGRQRTSVIMLARLADHLETSVGDLIPKLSEAVARQNKYDRVPISPQAPMLEKELREYNISPEKNVGLEKALVDIGVVSKIGKTSSPLAKRKEKS